MEVTTKTVKWAQPPSSHAMLTRKIVSTINGIYSIDCDEETVEEESHLFRVHIWDQTDCTWKRIPHPENQDKTQIAPVFIGFSAVAHGKFIYIWGGMHFENLFKYNIIDPNDPSLYQFNTETNIWTKPKQKGDIPDNKEFHGAVVTDGRMIIFGGAHLGEDESHEIFSLDLDTFTWTLIGEFEPELSLYRVANSFVFQDRFIYFFIDDECGGKEGLEENLACFDLQEKKFLLTTLDQENESTPDGSKLINGFCHGGLLYFFDIDVDCIYLFNPGNGLWKILDFEWKGSGSIDDVVVTKDQIIVFMIGDPNGEHIEDDEDVEFVHIFNFKCNLQSMCIMTAVDHNLDISSLPKKIKKKINNFKWIKVC